MTVHPDRLKILDDLVLLAGSHSSPEAGMCAMEAAAWLAKESFSDHPACVSPVLGAFTRSWNDALDDTTRQRLKAYIPRLIGTAGSPAVDERRAWMATDWACRVSAPTWLRKAGLVAEAKALESLAPIVDSTAARAAQGALNRAKTKAAAAGAATWAAARAAAWDAARAAARAAAGAAAWDAARVAAWDATWAAAWDATWAAARAAAWDAAGAATWAAARAAAGAATWAAARAAARDAARDALSDTVIELQESAFDLLDRLIECGREVSS